MTNDTVPRADSFTTAPLRHRLRVELHAPITEVWTLVGDHARMPEYLGGIAAVEVEADRGARVCHFRGPDGGEGPSFREHIRWERNRVGYATSGEPGNAFGLVDDLSLVTVTAGPEGTVYTWDQHYDAADLPPIRASFDEAFADMGVRLVARFGGRVLERYMDGPR